MMQRGVPAPDSLRAALDSVFAQSAYRWEAPRDPFAFVARAWNAARDWIDRMQAQNPMLVRALWWALLAVLALILLHAAWIAFRTFRGAHAPEDARSPGRTIVPRDAAWYRREADRLASQGRYAEALQADFLRLVLELDALRLLRFHPSRTPNEYVADPALPAGARAPFGILVRALYRYAFAGAPCGAAEFAQWRTEAAADRYARAH